MAIIERRRELLGGRNLPTRKAFNACTMAEINTFAPYAQQLVDAGVWAIGDTNSRASYGGYSGVRLVHCLTDTQRGSNYYGTTGYIVVEFVNIVTTSEWYSDTTTQVSYSGSTLLTTLNSMYASGLNSDFKAVLKTFAPATSVQSSTSKNPTTTSVEHPSGYLHSANCKELGDENYYRPSEDDYSFVFDYYSDSTTAQARRCKTGASATGSDYMWWTRSPARYSSNKYTVNFVYDTGEVGIGTLYNPDGVVPIAVI